MSAARRRKRAKRKSLERSRYSWWRAPVKATSKLTRDALEKLWRSCAAIDALHHL